VPVKTRSLENREGLLRASVTRAEILSSTDTSLVLKTSAQVAVKDPRAARPAAGHAPGDVVDGRLRIDVVSDTVLRIRYAEGECIPENNTPMVVGSPAPPSKSSVPAGRAEIVTAGMRVLVSLDPYGIEIRDLQGRPVCGVGGPEKAYFYEWDSYNTGVCWTPDDGSPIAVEQFDLSHDEAVYGFGEKFLSLNKVRQTIDLNMADGLGVTSPRSYKNVPFFVSTRGYGVFLNHSSLTTVWVGSMSAADIQVAVEDPFLDYYVFVGDIKHVLSQYTDLTGKGVVPPKWSFGYWQSKISYQSAEETLEIARELRAHEIPCDVIHLDTHWFKEDWYCDLEFDPERFADPKAYLDELASLGIKVSLWQLPYIPEGSKLFEDLKAVGGFVRDATGGIYDLGICFVPGFRGLVGLVDYTNPEAVRVHQDYFRRLFRLGAKVIKTDFGEAAPLDGVYCDGTPGHRMHNLYPLLYNRAIFQVTEEETGDGVVWARSAWAGNQRYPLHWGGDNSPNYDNMAPQLAGGLSFGLSGFQFWSQDIGGFRGEIEEDLLIRWMQMGVFLSHSRIHGSGDRELYKFGADTVRICRDYLRLRYRLMPYMFGSAINCVARSLPFARPLVVEYQDDPTTWDIYDEFLCGDSLLVAPILSAENRRRIYLPQGVWTDWWTRERLPGRQWIEVEPDLQTIPLYIREGAIIPMGPVMNYVDERATEALTLLVSLFAGDGRTEFTIPVNDEQVSVAYSASRGSHTLAIGPTRVACHVEPLGDGQLDVRPA
jgi:alpha-D-xyloside xylohydrolase